MANYYEQIRIKTATEGTHKRTMRADIDTSADFGQFIPLRGKLLELGQGKFRPYTISNMMPLPQPTFGEVVYENRIFAVPIHTIFKGYEDLRQDNIHITANESSASLTSLPYTKNEDIVKSIMGLASPVASSTGADFQVNNNGTIEYFAHTTNSAWWVKFLESLGYKWIWRVGFAAEQGGISKNVLRLLAAAKVYGAVCLESRRISRTPQARATPSTSWRLTCTATRSSPTTSSTSTRTMRTC